MRIHPTKDALIVVDAPENTRDGSQVPRERLVGRLPQG